MKYRAVRPDGANIMNPQIPDANLQVYENNPAILRFAAVHADLLIVVVSILDAHFVLLYLINAIIAITRASLTAAPHMDLRQGLEDGGEGAGAVGAADQVKCDGRV